LLRLGLLAELRRPVVRLALIAGAVFGAVTGGLNFGSAGATAIWLSGVLTPLLGVAACLWQGSYACRDHRTGRSVLGARPVDGAYLTAMLWATGTCLWLIGTVPAFLAAAVVQTPFAPLVAGPAHLAALARTAFVVASLGTLAFAVSRVLRSSVGGALVVVGWGLLRTGAGPLGAFQPDSSQNALWFGLLALLALSGTALLVERRRRGELRRVAAPAGIVAALLVSTVAGAAQTGWRAEDPLQQQLRERMGGQSLRVLEAVPGFWLPDGRGGTVRTADYSGKALLIYLFEPGDLAACRALSALNRARKEYGAGEVQPLGVCVTRSRADAWTLTTLGGAGFPIGVDLAEASSGLGAVTSPLLRAYHPSALPLLVVTDRRHRARELIQGVPPEPATLRRIIAERLAEEPPLASGEGQR
jgi:hypothetical protein